MIRPLGADEWMTHTRIGRAATWLLMLRVYRQPFLRLRTTTAIALRDWAVRRGDLA